MPDKNPVKQPQELPKINDTAEDTLKGILKWVQERKVKAENPQVKNVTKSSPWGWITGIFVALAVFVALAILAWRAWKKGREIAKLKHELDLRKEQEQQAKTGAALADNQAKREQLEKDAQLLRGESKFLKLEIEKLEQERKLEHEKIDKVTSWEDVDALLEE
jgi:cytochrome c-type biogenesis protein CcmH/NrfG